MRASSWSASSIFLPILSNSFFLSKGIPPKNFRIFTATDPITSFTYSTRVGGHCSIHCVMKETYKSSEEITDLVRAFESCTLDRDLWTHHAHMTLALWYLIRRPRKEATRLIREGIKRYN